VIFELALLMAGAVFILTIALAVKLLLRRDDW